jgi:hypothetical protein
MLFMDLDIFAKFSLDVFIVINFYASDELAGVDIARNTVLRWEYVQPKIACADHLND